MAKFRKRTIMIFILSIVKKTEKYQIISNLIDLFPFLNIESIVIYLPHLKKRKQNHLELNN
jgi:hypothetical protein